MQYVPPRRPIAGTAAAAVPAIAGTSTPRTVRAYVGQRPPAAAVPAVDLVATEVAYEPVDWTPTDASKITDALYEAYALAVDPHSRARRRIPPSSCSRRPWLPSHRQSRPIGRICQPTSSRMAFSRTPSSRASSMPARRIPSFSQVPGRSMRRLTSWRRRATMRRMPFVFAAAGFWATAPGRARDGRSPASCSTTGSRVAAARSGSASPTS